MPRKPGSIIRENIKKILLVVKEIDGYSLYKLYVSLFPQVTQRSIYYHLKKGTELEEFKVSRVEKISGNFSWGDSSIKIYYSLNKPPQVSISNQERNKIKAAFDKLNS
ncbi:MAG: hypothetical protein PWP03_433 [Candidatus Woesearchaeota archaeon]|nr:hypothetical protein [Candidatus Woesearchaeota archaeon]MDN5327795.1 hypothetical protein [Candidatus Woesearchaeota archaeon]